MERVVVAVCWIRNGDDVEAAVVGIPETELAAVGEGGEARMDGGVEGR